MAAVPGTLVDSLMSEYATPGRTPSRLRLVAFLPVLLLIAMLVAGCGASGPGANSTAAREAALRQIALEYAEDGDLEQATGALEKLKLANPGQLLVTLAEADLAAGRAREDIAATAALATMLGARSQKLMAYLSPTPIPAQAPVQAATLAPAQIALVEPTATEAPSPTAVPPTATPAPVATATPEPTVVNSPTPPPQPARVVADGNVNLRSGPGRAYPVIGTLRGGQETAIIARNENGDWWQVEGSNGALAWVAGTVVRVLGAIDAVSVAQNIPAPPTAAPRPTAAPQPTAAPVAVAVDYRIVETRMLTIQENGGCRGNHNIYVQVVDVNGAPLNGAVVTRVWAPQESVVSGEKDCYWHIGVEDEGCAHFDLFNASDNVLVVSDPVLGPVTSETSRTVTSKDVDLTVDELMANGYCTEGRENCEWRKNPGGNLPPQLCGGHYSWFVKFQRTH